MAHWYMWNAIVNAINFLNEKENEMYICVWSSVQTM